MMRRDVYTEEHELFRDQFRKFAAKEIEPKIAKWNHDGITDRETWQRMGQAGFLAPCMPEEYGGAGVDFRYDAIITEELTYMRAHGIMTTVHASICLPYLVEFGTEAQKQKYIPPAVRGDLLLGIGMTEPGAGSDLANIQTKAIRDGDHYVVNGGKTFISLGQLGGLYVDRRQDRPERAAGAPRRQPAPDRGRHARLRARPEAREARLPGAGHQRALLRGLPRPGREPARQGRAGLQDDDAEAAAGAALDRRHGAWRRAGAPSTTPSPTCSSARPSASRSPHFQNTQFKLAELATQIEIGQAFVDQLLRRPRARRRDRLRGQHGEVVDDRSPEEGHRRVPAAARRLRLHARVPDLDGLRRRRRPVDLRRLERDHEGHHREAHGTRG